jgi:hypothetical protein
MLSPVVAATRGETVLATDVAFRSETAECSQRSSLVDISKSACPLVQEMAQTASNNVRAAARLTAAGTLLLHAGKQKTLTAFMHSMGGIISSAIAIADDLAEANACVQDAVKGSVVCVKNATVSLKHTTAVDAASIYAVSSTDQLDCTEDPLMLHAAGAEVCAKLSSKVFPTCAVEKVRKVAAAFVQYNVHITELVGLNEKLNTKFDKYDAKVHDRTQLETDLFFVRKTTLDFVLLYGRLAEKCSPTAADGECEGLNSALTEMKAAAEKFKK